MKWCDIGQVAHDFLSDFLLMRSVHEATIKLDHAIVFW